MIDTKNVLAYYLSEDLKRYNNRKPNVKDLVLHNEAWYIFRYLRHLRYVEYYGNKMLKKQIGGRSCATLLFLYHWIRYKRLAFKLRFTIYPNTVGPGLRIYHTGDFVHIGPNVTIGRNCTILPGVVFGNKNENEEDSKVTVGDNCYFGLGAKVFGSVKIGNNVTVGANAVVTKDIPDNAVVGGVPAKVIRIK